MLYTIRLNKKWVYAENGQSVMTMSKFVRECQEEFQDKMTLINASICLCQLKLSDKSPDAKNRLVYILQHYIPVNCPSCAYAIAFSEDNEGQPEIPEDCFDDDDENDVDNDTTDLFDSWESELEEINQIGEKFRRLSGIKREENDDDEPDDDSEDYDKKDDFPSIDDFFTDCHEKSSESKSERSYSHVHHDRRRRSIFERRRYLSKELDDLDDKPQETESTALDAVNNLIGTAEFKDFCAQLYNRMKTSDISKTYEIFLSTIYVFFLGRGCNIRTYFRTFANLFCDGKLLPDKKIVQNDYYVPGNEENLNNLISDIEDDNYIFMSFDISEWIKKTDRINFQKFLQTVANRQNRRSLVVFYCKEQPENVQEKILEDIRNETFAKSVCIKELSDKDLLLIAKEKLGEYGYTITRGALPLLEQKIRAKHADVSYNGIASAECIATEIVDVKESMFPSEKKKITKKDMEAVLGSKKEQKQTAQKMLDELYGMDDVKKQLLDACNQISYAKKHGLPIPCMNMQFVGNPGTGKTTIARILGQLLREKGVLKVGNFYENHARSLCGQYIGHTETRTKVACEEAYGSVLFIDEAYSLHRDRDSEKDFGRVVIDTLIAQMENHIEDLVVIFAGYPKEMEIFESANPGLKSRIPFTIKFRDYNADEMYHIFERMIQKCTKKGFLCSNELLPCAKAYFKKLEDEHTDIGALGNARYIRNLYERTWGNAVSRPRIDDEAPVELLPEDFKLAADILKDSQPNKSGSCRIGFC